MSKLLGQDAFVRELFPLLFAALVGCVIGLVYLCVDRRRLGIPVANACVVLTTVMCLISRVVEDLATAFIVVGALTLVRLRAAIEDTREFSFLLLAVAAGLGCGERHYAVVMLGVLIVCALAFALAPPTSSGSKHRLSATVPNSAIDDLHAATASMSPRPSLRLRDQGEGRSRIRIEFEASQAFASGLLERVRAVPGVGDVSYDTQL